MDPAISLSIIKTELKNCQDDASKYGWLITEVDELRQSFTVSMKSPVDNEQYIVRFQFDNYREYPLFIEFIDPGSNSFGVKHAYPQNTDSFFHALPCICHPCSRKAYKQYSNVAPHNDWTLVGWQSNPQTGSLQNVQSILRAIYHRISDPELYKGRMKG